MPPLGLHMTIARDLADGLASPLLDSERGAYYLGSTTPDIRVITRWDRQRTHFFDLLDFSEQDGVARLFDAEPGLRDAHRIDAATAGFIAGYISHLVLDESYIVQIYRPIFGERSELGSNDLANLMDRLLQFEMDRRDRENVEQVAEIQNELAASTVEVAVDFIARETLLKWRDVSVDVLSHPPNWERFGTMARRHLHAAGIQHDDDVAKFMEDAPALLLRTIECVGLERIQEYLDSAKTKARRAMKEYLS
jgi:hypothetical protein